MCKLFSCGSSETQGDTVSNLNNSDDNESNINSEDNKDDNIKHKIFYKFIFLSAYDYPVGKTNILNVAKGEKFTEGNIQTIGVDLYFSSFESCDSQIKLYIWDATSQKKYQSIVNGYLESVSAIIFVYDITNKGSLDNLATFINDVKKKCNENNNPLFFLLGNKLDLAEENEESRQVKTAEAKKFAEDNNLIFLGECSAKDDKYNAVGENYSYRDQYIEQKEQEKLDCKDKPVTSNLLNIHKHIIHHIYGRDKKYKNANI